MNDSVADTGLTRTAAHSGWVLFAAQLHCSEDWRTQRCPATSMLDLIHTGVRLFLVGIACAVLAFVGYILSVFAYVTELFSIRVIRKDGLGYVPTLNRSHSTSHPRDYGNSAQSPRRKPRDQQGGAPKHGPQPGQPITDEAVPLSSATLQCSPPALPRLNEKQRRSTRNLRRSQTFRQREGPPPDLPKLEFPVWSTGLTTPLPPLSDVSHEVRGSAPAALVTIAHSQSDSSSNPSAGRSVASLSSDDHPHLPGRHVLKRIRESHSHLRERCLNRVHSMPSTKHSRPARRTDPYEAPYFFPTPMSPDAGTYLREALNERHPEQKATGESDTIERHVLIASPPSSPISPENQSHPPVLVLTSTPDHKLEANQGSPRTLRRHRWSFHIPRRPRSHERKQSLDADLQGHAAQDRMGAAEHRHGFPKFPFGHHRRRHEISSEDVQSPKS